jgi:hypothetical protein
MGQLFKSEHDILKACTAKIAMSVDLLKRIRWIQLFPSP